MDSVYSSDLHDFVEKYFNTIEAEIIEKNDDFFLVRLPGGSRERYTYKARIAAENRDIRLLARGSNALKEMVQKCCSRTAFSEAGVTYSTKSVEEALTSKKCCDLCPFTTICEQQESCCDFCQNFKHCHTFIENADFTGLGELKESKSVDIACFIFSVELSNDYSLSQKIEKLVAVGIDMSTSRVVDSILVRDISSLDFENGDFNTAMSENDYARYLKIARQGAAEILKKQLEVFKKEIEAPLKDKILSITDKYEEEYVENYTRSSLEQLEQMQTEAVRLCEREINGYTINCGYHLKNVIILHTRRDKRDILFKLQESERETALPADLFLGSIYINCSICGAELDTGYICDDGHVLCRNCKESCFICHSTICDLCDDESYICETCGESICADCMVKCASCGKAVCSAHGYECSVCGETYCIDCYDACKTCGANTCVDHTSGCAVCGEPVCPEHIHKCSVCGQIHCSDHIEECDICGTLLCKDHAHQSSASSRKICSVHKSECNVCKNDFAADEVKKCVECGVELCLDHVNECSACGKAYCSEHISCCKCCGSKVCGCTEFKKCNFCGQEYCNSCINQEGYCKTCEELLLIGRNDDLVRELSAKVPALDKYKRFYFNRSGEILVLYAKGLFSNLIIVANSCKEILKSRELGFIDDLKRKNKTGRRSRGN